MPINRNHELDSGAGQPDSSAGVSPAVVPAGTWAWLVATFFGAGRLKPGPGTWGSLATVLFWWILCRWIPPPTQTFAAIALALLAIAVGIPAATRVARETGIKDPGFVVIDEVAGQMITLIAVPVAWKSLLIGFILFRGFDIVKPPPLRRLERIPEGAGIVLDDVGAGLYGLAVLHILLRLAPLHR
jgi:phosphatidylglycerophosphatase A